MHLSWRIANWLFVAAFTVHNAEEGLWLPSWSQRQGYWRTTATAADMRWLLAGLTAAAIVCAWFATNGSLVFTYLVSGLALTMLVNVLVPHLAATLASRRYAPGTGTALCFNLPTGWWLLSKAVREGRISMAVFSWAGPLVMVTIVLLILLFFTFPRKGGPSETA